MIDRNGRQKAATRLREIAREADLWWGIGGRGPDALRVEAVALIEACLGATAGRPLTKRIDKIFHPVATFGTSVINGSPADQFRGLVLAAANLVGDSSEQEPRPPICDPELWAHVSDLVAIEAWAKIPAAVVTFVEDWFRRRGGDPRNEKGAKLVGTDLFNRVLTEFPLADQASERDGWRFLGMGLVQAIGNLHRHNIEKREDAESLAWDVIGLGSLLVGEMRRVHSEGQDGEA